jgi:GDP-L-fucose synthase
MNKDVKIYIAGHTGLVGSAILRALKARNFHNIVTRELEELDLRNQQAVEDFFKAEQPEFVFLAAAKVGGILANSTRKAEFFYDNIMIAVNVINAACKHKVKKLLNLGSSCIYPKLASQPLKEEYLLSDYLETTNEAYAIAKIAAIKMCKYYNDQYGTEFISVMPTNLYGPHDNFNLETSHVLPALIRKIFEAKQNNTTVTLWGDGSPMREFLFVEDLADAVIFLMENRSYKEIGDFVNIGTGKDISIKDLSLLIGSIIGYEGEFIWDTEKPNGTPKKLLDLSRLKSLGWEAKTSLKDGIKKTIEWYKKNYVRHI